MEYRLKEKIVHRVCSGILISNVLYKYKIVKVKFKDPSLDILVEADFIYDNVYNDLLEEGKLFTLDQSYKILIDNKQWNDKLERELNQLDIDIKSFQKELMSSTFKKNQQRFLLKAISKAKNRSKELLRIKNQLYESTIECIADQAKKRFIVSKIAEVPSSHKQLLKNLSFLNILIVCYYRQNLIKESEIREIARSDPWRLFWVVSKDTATSLFPHSAVEMSDYQRLLVSWSKIYDFAFESSNRPTEEVIEDDEKFDAWYKVESERIKKEIYQNSADKAIGTAHGQEVFIMADSESVQEVYDLNSPQSRTKVKQREKFIKEKGVVNVTELPDIKQDIAMQYNQMATQAITK